MQSYKKYTYVYPKIRPYKKYTDNDNDNENENDNENDNDNIYNIAHFYVC